MTAINFAAEAALIAFLLKALSDHQKDSALIILKGNRGGGGYLPCQPAAKTRIA